MKRSLDMRVLPFTVRTHIEKDKVPVRTKPFRKVSGGIVPKRPHRQEPANGEKQHNST